MGVGESAMRAGGLWAIIVASFVSFVVLILALAIRFTSLQLEAARPAGLDVEPVYLPRAEYLRPLSLGYENALANGLWFRTISYFGKHYRSDRAYPWLAYMCELVTDLDPRAEYVYRFAGMVLPWEAREVDEGLRLLRKGIEALPNSWRLHYWLGFSYYFFKDDYDNAVRYLSKAAALPDASPSAARLATILHQHRYGPETTLSFLTELAGEVESPELREVLKEQMKETRLTADLQALNHAVEQFKSRFGRLPPSTHALVESGLIGKVPDDPFGGKYEIDPDTGHARSSTGRKPSRVHESQRRRDFVRKAIDD
jgi:tetratricopeptide (TPR) repeat protein